MAEDEGSFADYYYGFPFYSQVTVDTIVVNNTATVGENQVNVVETLNQLIPVKRFMEQMDGGRNPMDCLVFIDNEDNVRVIGDTNGWQRFGENQPYSPGYILSLPNGEKASKVYVPSRGNMYILSTLGNVYATGLNNHGQCALPAGSGTANVIKPTATAITNCKKVIMPTGVYQNNGLSYSVMFLTNDGKVYSSGWNGYGQLGIGSTTNTANQDPKLTLGPGNTYGNPTEVVLDVVGVGGFNGGINHAETFCALLANGTVWCVGYGGLGQMGNGTFTATNTLWKQVLRGSNFPNPLQNVTRIAGGGWDYYTSFYAFTNNGLELYSWGNNANGQLALGDTSNRDRAWRVVPFFGNYVDIYVMNHYGVIVKMSNGSSTRYYACGYNHVGQLGLGNTTQQTSFQLITSLMGQFSSSIEKIFVCGGVEPHVFAKQAGTNKIFCTGHNGQGQLGLYNQGTNVTSFTEIPFNITSPIKDIMLIYTSNIGGYTLILTEDGQTYFTGQTRWGFNNQPDRNVTTFSKNTACIAG